jgi:hypothetical protein
MLKTLKNHWLSGVFGDAAARGGRLEASRSVLERLGSVLDLFWSYDAAFDATEVASKLLRSSFELLRSALGSILSFFEAFLDLIVQFKVYSFF